MYARLEYSNYSYIDNLGQTPSYILETSDVHIRLYSDAACTTPYVASAAFNLNLRLRWAKTTNSGTTVQRTDEVVTVPASSSSLFIMNLPTYVYRDQGSGLFVENHRSYKILDPTGVPNYIVVP